MTKCDNGCVVCPYIKECKSVKINQKQWNLSKQFNCNTFNVVYAITCQKENCRMSYIGETKRMLRFRVADHFGYVRNHRLDTATGAHFNSPGHSLADLRVTVIEQSKKNNHTYRKQR